MVKITCFLSFSSKNHAESSRNFVKNLILNPKRAKLDQKSWFGHVRTCQDQSRRTSPCQQSRFLLLFFKKLHLFIFINKSIMFIFENPLNLKPSLGSTISLFYLGVVATAIAWLMRFYILQKNGLVFQSQVAYIIPIFGLIFGYIFRLIFRFIFRFIFGFIFGFLGAQKTCFRVGV
mgnify:CR=1 FL=1